MTEAEFLALLRPLATDPAARGLLDDAAVIGDLVLTHDMLVEGVHFLSDDPPEDVAWKLLAVNLSDLAAKGAIPVGVLLGYPLSETPWDRSFVRGLADALATFDVPLLGGDTVKGPRVLSMTAIGRAAVAPARAGAQAGDALFVTGVIGLAGLGLAECRHPGALAGKGRDFDLVSAVEKYRRPIPRLTEGHALAPLVTAMMDVSDGLLIDAGRMADASGLALDIDIDAVPVAGDLMTALTAGDDYELLFAAPQDVTLPVAASRIGRFASGRGMALHNAAGPVPLPPRLGWQHGQ